MFPTIGSRVGRERPIKGRGPTSQYLEVDDSGQVLISSGVEPPTQHLTLASDGTFYISGVVQVSSTGFVLIGGVFGPSFPLEVFEETSGTNDVANIFNVTRASSGTPAAGIGGSLQYQIETTPNNFEVAGRINFLVEDVTSTAEDTTIRFDVTVAGAVATASWVPRVVRTSGAHTLSSTTATEITALQFTAVQPGTYVARYYLRTQSATATVGIGIGINFTGTATMRCIRCFVGTGTTAVTGVADDAASGGQVVEGMAANAFTTTAPNMIYTGGVATTGSDALEEIIVSLVVTAAGDLEVWHSSETATSTTVSADSVGILERFN